MLVVLTSIVLFTLFTRGFTADEAGRPMFQVGVLSSSNLRLTKLNGLKDELPRFGLREGENVEFLTVNAQLQRQQLPALAQELVKADVDVLVTTGRVETEAAKEATRGTGVPVIFMGLTALNQDQLVKDPLHPREGLTGVQNDHANLSGKRLELLAKLLPEVRKVLVIYDPRVVPAGQSLKAAQAAAEKLELELLTIPVSGSKDIYQIFQDQLSEIQAVLLLPSYFLESQGARLLVPLAAAKGLPVMGVEQDSGAEFFAVYGVPAYDQGKQAARIVAKVLHGEEVAEIPVEPPANLKLTVNLKVARQLGLKVSPSVLNYAEVEYAAQGDRDAE